MSNQDDPWASRVAAIFGEEIPQPENAPTTPRPSTAEGLADMLRSVDNRVYKSPVISRFQQAVGRERRSAAELAMPLFMESSSVEEPALGSMPYRLAELVTKETGLPRQVTYRERVYVKSSESLYLEYGQFADVLTSVQSLDLSQNDDESNPYIVGNWPVNIRVAGESYTLYREGQYDIVGFRLDDTAVKLDARSSLDFISVCSLCKQSVVTICTFDEGEIRSAGGAAHIQKCMEVIKSADCPNCQNKGKVKLVP